MSKKIVSIESLQKSKVIGKINTHSHKTNLLQNAVTDLQRQTGIDFLKVAIGDPKETQRLRFKQYQDALKLQ